jgi:DNA repair and recombination protein RAD52
LGSVLFQYACVCAFNPVDLSLANMPDSPGDQHKSNSAAAANPFLEGEQPEKKQTVSPYTASEIATLQNHLEKNLGPEFISSRPGAGGQKVYYLGAEKVINLANEVFGFNGWNSSIQNIQIDFVDEHAQTGKVTLGLSVVVRVTLRDGTYHEDVGYGHVENAKGKAAAFEKAKKQGTSDGLKRTLRNFGRVLGNCVYDKDYLTKVTKMKVAPTKWDPEDLHRHADFKIKKEAAVKIEHKNAVPQTNDIDTPAREAGDGFDSMDFDDAVFDDDELGNPDEFILPPDPQGSSKTVQPTARPSRTPTAAPNRANLTPSRPTHAVSNGTVQSGPGNASHTAPPHQQIQQVHGQQPQYNTLPNADSKGDQSSFPGLPSQHFGVQGAQTGPSEGAASIGFFSARAANILDENNIVVTAMAPAFNPHSESPSIRRDPKVDHTTSKRLLRNLNVAPPKKTEPESEEQPRRAPLPGQTPQSPMGMGRGFGAGQYRPPTRRGPDGSVVPPRPAHTVPGGVERVMNAAQRAPLTDVSNAANQHQSTATTPDGTDAKRQRLSGPPYATVDENRLSGEAG